MEGGDINQWLMLGRTVLSLGVVLVVIFGLAWVVKNYLKPERWMKTGNSSIQVTQAYPLESKKRLVVVQIEERRMLLGVSESNISFLCDLQAPAIEKLNSMASFSQTLDLEVNG